MTDSENNETTSEADADVGYFSEEAATFGDRVAAARHAAGLSPDSLCRKLGIKMKTLHAWEDDISEPRANKLQMLAGVLNVSLVWLLTGEGEGVPDPDSRDTSQVAEASELLAELRSIRAASKTMIERMSRLERRLAAALSA